MSVLIELDNITKIYRMGKVELAALRGINLSINEGEMLALVGASGSGKSTLMNILGFLDKPTIGKYLMEGIDVSRLNDDKLAVMRNQKIGFVFQNYNLMPRVSALTNVELPLVYSGSIRGRRQRCQEALERVGLGKRARHKPTELSGGEQQRVAIARALVNNPKIIFADEPTGNLDSVSSQEIIKIFCQLNSEGITIILVTHEMDIAYQAKRIVRLMDGKIVSDEMVQRDENSACVKAQNDPDLRPKQIGEQ